MTHKETTINKTREEKEHKPKQNTRVEENKNMTTWKFMRAKCSSTQREGQSMTGMTNSS